jgi:ankyrin repeat protein
LLLRCYTKDVNLVNRNGKSALHLASDNGHTGIVALLLGAGANADGVDGSGNTCLHLAGNEEIVKLLLARQISLLNAQNKRGYTPLVVACLCMSL